MDPFVTRVVIFEKKNKLQFSCRFHDLQLLCLMVPIEQWNLEDLIWAYFGRVSVDFRQYYVLFNLEWFRISWRVQLAGNITSDFLGYMQSSHLRNPHHHIAKRKERGTEKIFFNFSKTNSMSFIFSHNKMCFIIYMNSFLTAVLSFLLFCLVSLVSFVLWNIRNPETIPYFCTHSTWTVYSCMLCAHPFHT